MRLSTGRSLLRPVDKRTILSFQGLEEKNGICQTLSLLLWDIWALQIQAW